MNQASQFEEISMSSTSEEKGLISYVDEISIYGLRTNQVDIVINNDARKLPSNHISNISPTNNIPISTPNLKLDENGNIIPDDTFLKSNPFLIPSNSVKKTVEKENPNQYPTIIVTLPNDAILPYSPKIPMDIYYREGWVDYSNPNSTNAYNPKTAQKTKTYDYNYLAPLIPKNHFSLKLQQSFITKNKVQSSEITSKDTIPSTSTNIQQVNTNSIPQSSPVAITIKETPIVGGYYLNEDVNEYAEEYELVNHAFWWQDDTHQHAIAV
ncbi:hypothetical protein PIROE2DRAFT_12508 [Piromyces sp. E2]|nr:hypothetical protein PIROE2DRAFT_12508 [Piromyces sp. E2]|eukprot:OUM61457.1 hypothetical protein PIROE2DRAFT_12508 [Piromyces sp. E2]